MLAFVLDIAKTQLLRFGRFSLRVIQSFRKNNGILLASAVGYNMALSMVPLFALVLIALSAFFDEEQLLDLVSTQVRVLIPGDSETTRAGLESLIEQREKAGWISLGAMLFFGSLAFRMLETAMRTIFREHRKAEERTFIVSALMPFAFTGAIMVALIGVTMLTAGIDARGDQMNLPAPTTLLSIAGFFGLVLVFYAFYRLMPVGKVSNRRALAGGLVAATLWEIVRRLLQWWFASVSLVGVVYGSLTTVVVILLSMEIAAIILLLGAQVIAELEVSAAAGKSWFEPSEEKLLTARFHVDDLPK